MRKIFIILLAFCFFLLACKSEKHDTTLKFLIFGDSQSGTGLNNDTNYVYYKAFDTTIHNAFHANPDAKFFTNLGDLIEVGGKHEHWKAWFDAVKGVYGIIPFYPVLGNHETYKNSKESIAMPDYFIKRFKFPQIEPDILMGHAYSYDYGNVHFIVMDSQFNEYKEMDIDYACNLFTEEIKWLQQDLKKNKDKRWKVLMFHRPPYYNKQERSNDFIKEKFQEIIDSNHVDIVINGHDHCVAWTYPIKNDEFFEKPSQGTVYYIAGRSGSKKYPVNDTNHKAIMNKVWNVFFEGDKNYNNQPTYVVAEVNDNMFKLSAYHYKDKIAFNTLIIDKEDDKILNNNNPIRINDSINNKIYIFGVPLKIKNKSYNSLGYVPVKEFLDFFKVINKEIYINGEIDAVLTNYKFNLKKDSLISPAELGFICKYNKSRNILMISKDTE